MRNPEHPEQAPAGELLMLPPEAGNGNAPSPLAAHDNRSLQALTHAIELHQGAVTGAQDLVGRFRAQHASQADIEKAVRNRDHAQLVLNKLEERLRVERDKLIEKRR